MKIMKIKKLEEFIKNLTPMIEKNETLLLALEGEGSTIKEHIKNRFNLWFIKNGWEIKPSIYQAKVKEGRNIFCKVRENNDKVFFEVWENGLRPLMMSQVDQAMYDTLNAMEMNINGSCKEITLCKEAKFEGEDLVVEF